MGLQVPLCQRTCCYSCVCFCLLHYQTRMAWPSQAVMATAKLNSNNGLPSMGYRPHYQSGCCRP